VYDGFTYADVRDAEPGVVIEVGHNVVVGDDDPEPAVAEVVAVQSAGVMLLRVLPGPAEAHLSLVDG
jgi:hypothetical protein